MGFFDKLLQGLGFADENEKEETKEVKKVEEKKTTVGEYDLQEEEPLQEEPVPDIVPPMQDILKEVEEPVVSEPVKKEKEKKQTLTFAPQTQKEVQSVLENLKEGHNIIIKLSAFNESDIFRAMDFISGYCYCLNVKVKKINSDTFLLEIK